MKYWFITEVTEVEKVTIHGREYENTRITPMVSEKCLKCEAFTTREYNHSRSTPPPAVNIFDLIDYGKVYKALKERKYDLSPKNIALNTGISLNRVLWILELMEYERDAV